MGERFGRYSKYIIQERALPDIRDGLKPVQRRILYSMNKDGNTHDKGYRKSAKSVGNIMGNFHPHGDSSIYDAMVRMSQDWICVIQRRVCKRLSDTFFKILIKTPFIWLGTLMIQRRNQPFYLQPFQTSWLMVLQGFLLVMPQTFHRIICQRSSMPLSI